MKTFFLLTIIVMCAGACSRPAADNTHTREMFNAGNMHVITSFANRKQQTMSVLYGDDAAKKCALSGYKTHFPKEVFTLVVYRQANSKYWYGSYINGAVQSVEVVADLALAGKVGQLTYQLQQGQAPADSLGHPASAADRISYILSHKPSVFP